MKAFEFAVPNTEEEVLEFLSARPGETELLAGGTDVVGLMKNWIVAPDRVVSLAQVPSLRRIERDPSGVRIGAMVSLEELAASPELDEYQALKQAVAAVNSAQLQAQGTLGGELCQRPRCWYYRAGSGLLADSGRLAADGDNRYHAIFGNRGPAKFVSASRLAPALIALDARLRLVGPSAEDQAEISLRDFFTTPGDETQRENVLRPNQFVSHIVLPAVADWSSAHYEVRHGEGPDFPLVAASACLRMFTGRVAEARIVLGQVAPVPWVSREAAQAIVGRSVDAGSAMSAGEAAAQPATPLAHNGYKVQLARVAVKRAILLTAGLDTGGF